MAGHIKTFKDVLDIFEPYLTTEDILEIIDEIKSEEIDMDIKIGGLYRHCKGGLYTVMGVATNSENLGKVVIYRDEVSGRLWVRPASMWNDVIDGKRRFELISSEELIDGNKIMANA